MTTNDKKLLDEVLPLYDISARYSIRIFASPDKIYKVVQKGLPVGTVTKLLMALRKIPSFFQTRNDCEVSPEEAFYRLIEVQNREIVLGIVGQFYQPVSRPLKITSFEEFVSFQRDGFCKAALNLKITEETAGECLLSTETRVLSFGDAKKKFKDYWRLIGPFSGFIRKEILRKIKHTAEKTF